MLTNKQRGQGNTGLIFVLVAVAIVFIIAAIALNHNGDKHSHSRRHGKHTVVKGEFLTPTQDGRGRYAYQNDGGDWYIYYWMMTDNSRYSYSTPPPLTGYVLPSGGQWAKVTEPDEDEVVEQENEEIAETDTDVPETESAWQTENQTDIENQSVEPENTVEPSSEPSTPSDSSPSDSGGDSGGDGGGDGGGSSD